MHGRVEKCTINEVREDVKQRLSLSDEALEECKGKIKEFVMEIVNVREVALAASIITSVFGTQEQNAAGAEGATKRKLEGEEESADAEKHAGEEEETAPDAKKQRVAEARWALMKCT